MSKKNILITGATGLLGSHVLEKLSVNNNLFVLVRNNTINSNDLRNIKYYVTDFSKSSLPADLPKKIDSIIHLAQSHNPKNFPATAQEIFNINVKATALLLDYAHKSNASNFIYTSTGGLYGPSTEPCNESHPINISNGLLNFYFRSKIASENLIQAYTDIMSVIILRPFFIYGPKQNQTMFIPKLINNIKNGMPIMLQGQDGILVNPVYVADVANLIHHCLQLKTSNLINVAGPKIISIRQIAEIISENLGIKPVFTKDSNNNGNILGDNSLMRTIYKNQLTDFKDGLIKML